MLRVIMLLLMMMMSVVVVVLMVMLLLLLELCNANQQLLQELQQERQGSCGQRQNQGCLQMQLLLLLQQACSLQDKLLAAHSQKLMQSSLHRSRRRSSILVSCCQLCSSCLPVGTRSVAELLLVMLL